MPKRFIAGDGWYYPAARHYGALINGEDYRLSKGYSVRIVEASVIAEKLPDASF